jgi:hypothetical protein
MTPFGPFSTTELERLTKTAKVSERTAHMRIVVDLNRCESYVQCVFAAPTVFRLIGEESFEFDYAPDDAVRV